MTQITITKADGAKCPRCWNYHTVQGNPQGVCDRCMVIVTNILDEMVADGRCTQAAADEWRFQIQNTVNRWKGLEG